jgi:hypothetical protein
LILQGDENEVEDSVPNGTSDAGAKFFIFCLGALSRNSAGRAGAAYRDDDAELRFHGGQCVQRDGYYRMSEAIQRIRFDGRREGASVFYFSACRRKLSPNGSQA